MDNKEEFMKKIEMLHTVRIFTNDKCKLPKSLDDCTYECNEGKEVFKYQGLEMTGYFQKTGN